MSFSYYSECKKLQLSCFIIPLFVSWCHFSGSLNESRSINKLIVFVERACNEVVLQLGIHDREITMQVLSLVSNNNDVTPIIYLQLLRKVVLQLEKS